VLDPLARLKAGLKQVEEGDLSTRGDVASRDEFGDLSAGFNRMAGNLQSAYQNLEHKVREKTASLEVERARLAALYDVSAFLAKAASLDELAKGFARRVREIARADAAAVRWSDEANRHYLLMAGDCLPEAMARDEHCLLTGSCHCGQPRATARARVIPIHAAAPAPFDNCARAGFETLVTVPVLLQGRVLGEIDLFYRSPITLSDEERGLLDALASHLASAMEGRRASALEREAAVADERGLLARELHDSIAQSLAFLKIQAQLLREALGAGDAARAQAALGELDAGLRESTGDVRELLMHFRTRTNAEDIEPARQHTLKKFEHQTGLATHLAIEGHGLPLDADVQVQVLHVVQEALSNVRKHAGATQVWIEVQRAPQWRFEVRDDGRGFAGAVEGSDETHVGLRIMAERARRIGAAVEIDSVPGAGTCVSLILPAQKSAAPAAAAASA
ncbi:MAG: HAMP domain-containing protein, partial [Burkholderiales bacterium]|nr:HAMP domain-containing protein [Burkholderiales bacterium]